MHGAAHWVLFRVECLAQGHNHRLAGYEPPTFPSLDNLLYPLSHRGDYEVQFPHGNTGSSISSLSIHYPHVLFFDTEHILHFWAQNKPSADGKSILGCSVLVKSPAGRGETGRLI